jgi:hypothetical protein
VSVVFIDKDTLKPGCVIVQAALGGDRDLLYEHFDETDWKVDGIEGMIPCPAEQAPRAAEVRRSFRNTEEREKEKQ